MKNSNNISPSLLEAMAAQQHLEIQQEIKINAKSFGQQSLPKPMGDSLSIYFEEHHLRYQIIIDEANKNASFQSTCHSGVTEQKNSDEKIKSKRNDVEDLERQKIPMERELKALPECPSKLRVVIVIAILICISLFEGILAIPTFETLGLNLVESIVAGLLFAVIIASIAHMASRIIDLNISLQWKKILALLTMVFMCGLFFYMAKTRADYLTANAIDSDGNQLFVISPILIFFLSLALFVTALGLCSLYFPNKEQREVMRTKANLLKQQKALLNEIQNRKSEIMKINENLIALKEECGSILSNGCMLEEIVIHNAKIGFALWKRENFKHRPDNLKPQCFDSIYPFQFTTYFHSIKSLGNENNNK
jgi:hypothetical protein